MFTEISNGNGPVRYVARVFSFLAPGGACRHSWDAESPNLN